MKLIRGYLSILSILALLLLCDPVQRLIIAPWVKLFPSQRIRVLNRWQKLMAVICTSPASIIGGARFPTVPTISSGPGVLIIMNHQSIFDIPQLVKLTPDAYPHLVTRKRYARWIPLISHMIRLYQYPVVDPTANSREMKKSLRYLKEVARTADVPIAIFAEGTRTRDGEIAKFRRRGLQMILKQREWKVYAVVFDGFWERAKLKDFLRGMGDIRGQAEIAGEFEWTDPSADSEAFIEQVRDQMVEHLAQMRETTPA